MYTMKQSLKKWEIELGIHHVELNLPWDKPVPESMWDTVAEYCDNDVLATEAVFNANYSDFKAREILADLSGLTVNDTNNQHTAKMIFGGNREPQSQFNYRFMGIPEDKYQNVSVFIRSVITYSINDINEHTPYFIEYEKIKPSRTITGFKFFLSKQEEIKEMIIMD